MDAQGGRVYLESMGKNWSAAQSSVDRRVPCPFHTAHSPTSAPWSVKFPLFSPEARRQQHARFSFGLCHSWNVQPCQEQKITDLTNKYQDP